MTGASGFVGAQVLNRLSQMDLEIRVVSRPGKKKFFASYENVTEVIQTNNFFTETSEWYEKLCQDIDIVIHLAWYAERGKYLESSLNIECLSGTLNFASAAAKHGIKKFVGVGTCFEYDLDTVKGLDVNSPLNPRHLYSISKSAAFLLLSKLFLNKKIDFLWTRIFYLYGEGEDDRSLVAELRKKLKLNETIDLTQGKQIRDFMDVAVAGSVIADASMGSNVGPFNVCSGEGISVRQLAENIADEYGGRSLLNFGARKDNLSDEPFVVGIRSKVIDIDK